jgi:hypothetical protein
MAATPAPAAVTAVKPEPTAKEKKEKKLLITGAAAVMVLFVGGLVSWRFTAAPKVDQKLVSSYLAKTGQVQGVQTQAANAPGTANKDADLPYEQTKWEQFNDPILGVALTFPANLITKTATETSITFLRKEGYIFKVQRVKTSQTVDEYWEQIKNLGFKYTSSPAKWKNKDALLLTMEDTSDYPGNRYLIKNGDSIFEVWYAVPGGKFSNDDIKRSERMLDSVSFQND